MRVRIGTDGARTRYSGALDVVGDHHGLCLQLARSQRLEIGSVVGAKDNSLAVNHNAIDRQRGDGIANAREGVAVVRRGAGPQAATGDRPQGWRRGIAEAMGGTCLSRTRLLRSSPRPMARLSRVRSLI